jgi:ABC-type histidine transport system ATPase subunit
MSEDKELEQILEDLKSDESITSLNESPSAERIDINDDNVNDYVMQKVGKLVESGIETVEALQQTIASGFEADELNAFSTLLASVTHAADTLNKINLQNKKEKAARELKMLDVEAKKELGPGQGPNGNTNILIATREEVIERFLDKQGSNEPKEIEDEPKAIEGEFNDE